MQGIYSLAGVVGCLGAATRMRSVTDSTIPVPGNIAAWFWFRDSGRLRLSFRDLVAPAIVVARQGFTLSPALATALHLSSSDLTQDLRTIYLGDSASLRALVRNPALSELLRVLAESTCEDQFWRILRSSDPGPWQAEEGLENPVRDVTPRSLDAILGPNGEVERLFCTGNLETWGTWTLVGAAVAVELRKCRALDDFGRAMEAYVLATILDRTLVRLKESWWRAALGFSYAMQSRVVFEGQKHDVTEMSPLILETTNRPRLAIGAAGSERILGALTYLLFLRFGLGLREDMTRLMSQPTLFPKDGGIRVHREFCQAARSHLESRGFTLTLADYSVEHHLGIVNLVERLDSGSYKSGTDLSGDGWAV
ncbi:gamma-glutamyltransferase [Mesorhizobium sp. C395A]|nr:gamma-glutamyltransferase [Mesorhizobium sp. C395A]WJI74755.1 gamma-glutamyltransferase family protein [Mesorhizobium sp. C395A]